MRTACIALVACFFLFCTVAATSVDMIVTGYCSCTKCCGSNAKGITTSGRPVTSNGGYFCAAPRGYKLATKDNRGTWINIPGYNGGKPVPVLDRGGDIKGNRLDVFFKTHSQALQWGKQKRRVTVTRH
jgi:3D (Asp-Asp-Asp) domain-containing protein